MGEHTFKYTCNECGAPISPLRVARAYGAATVVHLCQTCSAALLEQVKKGEDE